MNRYNVVGLNFEQYNDVKPTQEIRRKIANLFMEYNESGDSQHASQEFVDICEVCDVKRFIVVGHILNNAFSQDPTGWNEILKLVTKIFFE